MPSALPSTENTLRELLKPCMMPCLKTPCSMLLGSASALFLLVNDMVILSVEGQVFAEKWSDFD